jgi:hypothetical protein
MAKDNTRARALEEVIAAVTSIRPHLVDSWEATALIESLGYTDARIRRELGFSDAAALGAHVFAALSARPRSRAQSAAPRERRAIAALLSGIAISLVYAVPWLLRLIVERMRPETMPAKAALPLSLALMLSMVVSGGFVQAITRRGRFYVGQMQTGLAALVCGYLLRLGAIVSLGFAVCGVLVGWYFDLSSWPYLVVWADEFLVLAGFWMLCGVLAIRDEHWRAPLAFAAGGVAFVATRAMGHDALLALLVGSGAAVGFAAVQVPRVFVYTGLEELPGVVPLPRMSVVLYRTLPFFLYGAMYFCFLFIDRVAASAFVWEPTSAAYGIYSSYGFGMDLALLTFLLASAGVDYGDQRFTTLLARAMNEPFDRGDRVFERRVRRGHLRQLGFVVAAFVLIAAAVAVIARRLFPGDFDAAWTTVAAGDAGYLLIAIGIMNALALFRLNRPWDAVNALAAGLAVNLMVGLVLSWTVNADLAVGGLVAGAFVLAVHTSVTVRRTIRAGSHAISAAA